MKAKIKFIISLLVLLILYAFVLYFFYDTLTIINTFTIIQLPMSLLFVIIAVLIDRFLLIKYLKQKIINVAEILLLSGLIAVYLSDNSFIYYNLNNEARWFVVVYTDKAQSETVRYSFPLNKSVNMKSECLNFIDRREAGFRHASVNGEKTLGFGSGGYKMLFCHTENLDTAYISNYYRSGYIDNPDYIIYKIAPYRLTQSDLDTIKTQINDYLSRNK